MSSVDRRVAVWIDLVADLAEHPTTVFPRRALSAQLHETFGSQVSWNRLDASGKSGFDLYLPMPGWPPPELMPVMIAAIPHHPLVRWFNRTRDPTAMSIGRIPPAFVTRQGRALVREILAPVGMEQQLSIPYRLAPGTHRAFVLARSDSDFSDEDLQVSRQVQPLLRLLDRQTRVFAARLVPPADCGELTGRELAVLLLLSDGLTAAAIGSRLGISPRTVHRHLSAIYHKLGVCDRVRAVGVARQAGMLSSAPGLTARPAPLDSHSNSSGTVSGEIANKLPAGIAARRSA